MAPITIHVVFNAHLDPIWMWPWTSGLDEAMATCRSACDRLDAHPELFFTQGEAWTFAMVERADPALFRRIRAHVGSGRWEVVNGWWTQPDCNFPSVDGLHRQLGTGLAWVKDRFGLSPRCGFNPDSFGHCAILPEVLREHGQDRYVFMRPMENEKRLPGRLFTWRSRPGGAAVTAFHIASTYGNGTGEHGIWAEGLRRATDALPAGCHHTMAFCGVSDHGGGPTEKLVRWIAANRDVIPGARLEFSTCERFFAAVEREAAPLPEVVGELQIHAIGCYSVVRSVKSGVRRAEHTLARAEAVALPDDQAALAGAWQAVASHHFHDTLGGTCPPDAYRHVEDQLGGAAAMAEELLAYGVRRQLAALPDDPLPRLILANPGAAALAGWHEASIYVEGSWRGGWRLIDDAGVEVPFQALHPGLGIDPGWPWGMRRMLVRRTIPAGGLAVLRLDATAAPAPLASAVDAGPDRIASRHGAAVALGPWGATLRSRDGLARAVGLHLIADSSDTWTHGADRYADGPALAPTWSAPALIESGPLRASLLQEGLVGDTRLVADWRVHADADWVELLLEVHWRERHRVLKLVLPAAGEPTREDGTPGMALARPNDGRELPLHDWTRCGRLGVVCPDAWAIDGTAERLRFTLLRAPLMAHHDPSPAWQPRVAYADQGVHRFRFRFHLGGASAADLAAEALAWHCPALTAELTRGMPARMIEGRG
jgi:alpha-mannosidase